MFFGYEPPGLVLRCGNRPEATDNLAGFVHISCHAAVVRIGREPWVVPIGIRAEIHVDGDDDPRFGGHLEPDAEKEVIASVIVTLHPLTAPDAFDNRVIGEVLQAQSNSES